MYITKSITIKELKMLFQFWKSKLEFPLGTLGKKLDKNLTKTGQGMLIIK